MRERRHPWRDHRGYDLVVPPVVFASPTPRDAKAVKLAQARDKAYDELGRAVERLLRATLAEDYHRAVTMVKAYGRPEPLPERREMLEACKDVAGEQLHTLGLLAETALHDAIDGYLFPPQNLYDQQGREYEIADLEPPPGGTSTPATASPAAKRTAKAERQVTAGAPNKVKAGG